MAHVKEVYSRYKLYETVNTMPYAASDWPEKEGPITIYKAMDQRHAVFPNNHEKVFDQVKVLWTLTDGEITWLS